MKAIVTGSNGFVGPHLIDHLKSSGDTVIALSQGTGPDLCDRPAWIDAFTNTQPDAVYHLAGWSDVGASWNNPDKTVEINTMGTLAVLEAARQCGSSPRVVLVSSADVYGKVQPDDLPLSEVSPVQPCSPYGGSKQAAEALAQQSFRGFGVEAIVARPFNHIGPGQATRFIAASFAAQIAQAEQNGGGLIRHGDLSPRRDITDVRDVVRAYRLLVSDGQPGETYNICSQQTTSMAELLEILTEMSSVTISTEVNPDLLRPVELPVLEGSYQKLSDATGWKPTLPLAKTLEDILQEARTRASLLRSGDK